MRPYQVYINQAALMTAPRSGVPRARIMKFVAELSANPFQEGDFQQQDLTGRMVQIKIVAGYSVTFWADHPVAEVKITHIKRADV